MVTTDFDVVIGGTKAKILKTEDGGYSRQAVRREIRQNVLSQSGEPAFASRDDQPSFFQTSWAGGSRWWKPLMVQDELDSYFQANHMDLWSQPGKVVPGNQPTETLHSLHDHSIIATDSSGDIYAIGETNNENAAFLDVYKWTPASDDFVQETGYHSGVPVGEDPTSMVFDSTDGFFYVHNETGSEIVRFNPTTATQNAAWLTGVGGANGTRILLHREGLLIYHAFSRNTTLSLIDKSGPSFSQILDDGMGQDFIGELSGSSQRRIISAHNVVTTPEGIYYVINTLTGGQVEPWVFRVDRDEAGSWIGFPIATLPRGTVSVNIAFHLGQLIVATTPDVGEIKDNDLTDMEIIYYFVGQDGMGALGSVLGPKLPILDDTAHVLLGSSGPYLYIGGNKRLYIYDAIRGGIHTAWKWPTETTFGAYRAMAWATDSDADSILIFSTIDRFVSIKTDKIDDPDTVVSLDTGTPTVGELHYELISNFFDAGLPMEDKELAKVEINHGLLTANQHWVVLVNPDDTVWTKVLDTSTAVSFSEIVGRKFQYALVYETTDTERVPLDELQLTFVTGEQVTEWDLILDGTAFLNVDNEPQDEEEFFDAMVTLSSEERITTLVDNMQEQGQESDTVTDAVNVKVMAVEIVKRKAGESDAVRVVLREP